VKTVFGVLYDLVKKILGLLLSLRVEAIRVQNTTVSWLAIVMTVLVNQ